MIADKIFIVNCSNDLENDVFMQWMQYLKPKHKLTPIAQKVLASIMRYRYELSRYMKKGCDIDDMCTNLESRKMLANRLDMSYSHFQIMLQELKKAGLIAKNDERGSYRINPEIIPNISEEDGVFKLMIGFKYDKITDIYCKGDNKEV